MSSIKYGNAPTDEARTDRSLRQVQDLQSQIAELTQMNSHLAELTQLKPPPAKPIGADAPAYERIEPKRRHSEVHFAVPVGPQKIAAPVIGNFDHVRENIRTYSKSIFITSTTINPAQGTNSTLPDLPPRADFARISRAYIDSVHEWYPTIHWPTFQRDVDDVYAAKSFEGATREWVGLFFAMLACGTLQSNASQLLPNGTSYFEAANQILTPWPRELTIEYAQAALLLSIYATEQNWRVVGSMWLGTAARAAQELNVHCSVNTGSVIDSETRRRLWWAIYTRDR
jgi:hypothetical protein